MNIYESLQRVLKEGDKFPTDSIDEHVAELFMFDFEQSGIHLPPDKVGAVATGVSIADLELQNFFLAPK